MSIMFLGLPDIRGIAVRKPHAVTSLSGFASSGTERPHRVAWLRSIVGLYRDLPICRACTLPEPMEMYCKRILSNSIFMLSCFLCLLRSRSGIQARFVLGGLLLTHQC